MNATTPLWTLVACLAASLACAPASADEAESCVPVQVVDGNVEYHDECMPSSAAQDGPASTAGGAAGLASGVVDMPGSA